MTEYKRKNVWENLSQDQEKELESLSKDYMDFLDKGKTERLAAKSGQLQTVWSSKRNGTMG